MQQSNGRNDDSQLTIYTLSFFNSLLHLKIFVDLTNLQYKLFQLTIFNNQIIKATITIIRNPFQTIKKSEGLSKSNDSLKCYG